MKQTAQSQSANINDSKQERLVKNERRNSLSALLRAIKFRTTSNTGETTQKSDQSPVQQHFAQPRPRARQRSVLAEENYWVRSAN
ncbi:MAG: hypothetical protein Cons2KO_18400 [Congregibacter sp.]